MIPWQQPLREQLIRHEFGLSQETGSQFGIWIMIREISKLFLRMKSVVLKMDTATFLFADRHNRFEFGWKLFKRHFGATGAREVFICWFSYGFGKDQAGLCCNIWCIKTRTEEKRM